MSCFRTAIPICISEANKSSLRGILIQNAKVESASNVVEYMHHYVKMGLLWLVHIATDSVNGIGDISSCDGKKYELLK